MQPQASNPVSSLTCSSTATARRPAGLVNQAPRDLDGTILLDRALAALKEQDRNTIRKFLPQSARDVESALQCAWDAAEKKRMECEKKQWVFSFRGRKVILRNQARKVLKWLDRFKGLQKPIHNTSDKTSRLVMCKESTAFVAIADVMTFQVLVIFLPMLIQSTSDFLGPLSAFSSK